MHIMKLSLLLLFLICGFKPSYADSDNSIYQASIALTTQHAKPAKLDIYRGHPVLITMFYGSCPDMCPMLVMSMQMYEKLLNNRLQKNLRSLIISFDAARDTPQQLQAIATMHHVDSMRWMFASANEVDARKLAALLGIQYRQKPDGTFDHSVLITLLDAEGRVIAATDKLNGDAAFIASLHSLTDHVTQPSSD